MKKTILLLFAVLFGTTISAQIINFPDAALKTKLLSASPSNIIAFSNSVGVGYTYIDSNFDGEITVAEASIINYLNIVNSNITNLSGIENFTNLTNINCSFNNLQSLSFNGMNSLFEIRSYNCNLTSLNLSNLPNLKKLECNNNALTTFNINTVTSLEELNCEYNSLSTLPITGLVNLKKLTCSFNTIPALDLTSFTNLNYLACRVSGMNTLNITGLTNLQQIICNNNQLTSLNLTGMSNLNYLYCSSNNLTSLNVTGLTSLERLYCSENSLTSLTVSNLPALTELLCDNNQLSSLNISNLSSLTTLSCFENLLTSLSFTNCPSIVTITCNNNLLNSLNVTGLNSLNELNCRYNNLTSLNLNTSINLDNLYCNNNQLTTLSLFSGQLKKLHCYNNNLTSINFNTSNAAMDDLLCYNNQLTSLTLSGVGGVSAKYIYCSNNLISGISFDSSSLSQLKELDIANNNFTTLSTAGMTNLQKLICNNNSISSLSLSGLTNLNNLNCSFNTITSLDIRNSTLLSQMISNNNQLTTVYLNNGVSNVSSASNIISGNPTIETLCTDTVEASAFQNLITTLGYNCEVTTNCSTVYGALIFPDVNFKSKLLQANTTNNIAKNNLGNSIKIDTNNDLQIQASEVANVYSLNVDNSTIADLEGICYFTNLTRLECANNQLQELNVSCLSNLNYLNCNANQISNLDLGTAANLSFIYCNSNALDYLDLRSSPLLNTVNCSLNVLINLYLKNDITEANVNFSGNPTLESVCVDTAQETTIQSLITGYGYTNCNLTTDCNPIIFFPDLNFKNKLLSANSNNQVAKDINGNFFKIDRNNNGEIEDYEAFRVSYLNVESSSISSLTGISYFKKLTTLNCGGNQISGLDINSLIRLENVNCSSNQLTVLDLNSLINLKKLDCSFNQLTALGLTTLTDLEELNCSSNQITVLNASNLSNLTRLDCYSNLLSTLNLNGLSNLTNVSCSDNQIQDLSITGLTNLIYLNCSNNLIEAINADNLNSLNELYCSQNLISTLTLNGTEALSMLDCSYNSIVSLNTQSLINILQLECSFNILTSIDVSNSPYLQYLGCESNQIVTLYIKNGSDENISINDNPTVQYICTDDIQTESIQQLIAIYGYTNCNVNSYCSFVPGGSNNGLTGSIKFDSANDGCTETDINYPNIKLSILDEYTLTTSEIITGNTDQYSIPLPDGYYTITPIIENPDYFSISPTSLSISFPDAENPVIQDFCVIPIGIHNDLKVLILPLDDARPGFDANYKIVFKNKGTASLSGSVNLNYDDAVMDFVFSSTTPSSQLVNTLVWDFVDLLPFETRQISVRFNLNTPTETPALNGDDTLSYSASISDISDENLSDNQFELNQIVVNSFDPNDKACLEGTVITSAMVGEFVHYKIRFENTGTYPAQNIVVKDIIDTSKFDISTLQPVDASHPSYITRITDINKVEFIFENIYLPFDDQNNDGFIIFKIKTWSGLVVDDVLENTADIYFDYNFPITTNTATTTVSDELSNPEFDYSDNVILAPNPAKNILRINFKNPTEISEVKIYSITGQKILSLPIDSSNETIDVSRLSSGLYCIEIVTTDSSRMYQKFIKE